MTDGIYVHKYLISSTFLICLELNDADRKQSCSLYLIKTMSLSIRFVILALLFFTYVTEVSSSTTRNYGRAQLLERDLDSVPRYYHQYHPSYLRVRANQRDPEAIKKCKAQLAQLRTKQASLDKMISDDASKAAAANKASNKRLALAALKSKKAHEDTYSQNKQKIVTLETQLQALENAKG